MKPEIKDPKVIDIINKIARQHSRSQKKFGYLTKDDLFNEIWVICLEKIHEFDESKGDLERFLRVIVRNRLINRSKDITKLIKSPCPACPFYKPGVPGDCKKFGESKHQCDKWAKYELNKSSRDSLLNASEDKVQRHTNDNILENITGQELKQFLLERIEEKYKRDFEEYMNKGKLPNFKLVRLENHLKEIIHDFETRKEQIKLRFNILDTQNE